jgi:hypothetical protein
MMFSQVCTVAQLVACDSLKKIVALQHSLGMDRQAICMYVVDFCFICLDSEYKQRCCEGDTSVPPEMEPEALAFEVATLVHGVTDDAAALFTDILADPQALNSSKWKGCMGCRMDVISSAVKLIGQQVGHRLGRTLAVFLQMMLQKERLKVRRTDSHAVASFTCCKLSFSLPIHKQFIMCESCKLTRATAFLNIYRRIYAAFKINFPAR